MLPVCSPRGWNRIPTHQHILPFGYKILVSLENTFIYSVYKRVKSNIKNQLLGLHMCIILVLTRTALRNFICIADRWCEMQYIYFLNIFDVTLIKLCNNRSWPKVCCIHNSVNIFVWIFLSFPPLTYDLKYSEKNTHLNPKAIKFQVCILSWKSPLDVILK